MATDPERYLTAEELQRELPFDKADINIDLTDSDYKTLLNDVLRSESARIERWAETQFSLVTETEPLSRPKSAHERELPLPARPIASVDSVTVEGDALTEGTDYAVEETHVVLLKDNDVSLVKWPTDYRAIEVTWSHGYDGIPEDAKSALIRLCRARLKQTHSDGKKSESTGDGASVSYEPEAELKANLFATVHDHAPPSYYGGASVV
jgi:hypothetical protein